MTPSPELHTTSTFAASAVVVFVLQILKKWQKIPWINQESAKLNRVLAVVLSGISALGVTWVFTPAVNGGHVITITIPSLVAIVGAAWIWLKSFAIQEWIYQSSVTKDGSAPKP